MNRRIGILNSIALLLAFTAYAFAQSNGGSLVNNVRKVDRTQEPVVRFIAFGDMGTGDSDQYALARRMAVYQMEYHFDTALTLGDNIYPDGNSADLPAKFEKPYAELLRSGVHFYASLGNHDVRRGREAQINYSQFNMGGRAYYSFTKGDGLVEFFALDSTAFDSAQLKWLTDALVASKASWKIVYFHHPLYSSGRTHGSDLNLRRQLEPLFVRFGVAAVFSGHDHVYERVKPQQGVQYFVAGAGSGKLRRGDLNRRSEFFAAGNDEVGSFMYVEIAPEKLSFRAVDAAGNILDQGAITRGRSLALAAIAAEVARPTSSPVLQEAKPPLDSQPAVATVKTTSPAAIKMTREEARTIALKTVPGTVESSEMKRKDGKLVYEFKIRSEMEVTEIGISADDGQIVKVKHKSAKR